ncbi:MAG TPA: PEGA domain-containing protein [Candidatus Acidoferrum sp.]|nr:PEGA domain-containing protein [Candidatus Acidoferrum sp.]
MQPSRRLCIYASLAATAILCAGPRTFAETLVITTSPPGAAVEIDGVPAGETPFRVDYPGGYFHKTHTVFSTRLEHAMVLRVSKDGYLPQQMTLTSGPYQWIGLTGKRHGIYFLLKSEHFDIHLEAIHESGASTVQASTRAGPLRPRRGTTDPPAPGDPSPDVGSVAIASDPPGADIYVDGKFVGQTPSTVRLPSGEHRIEVKSHGKATWQRDLEVLKASDLTLHPILQEEER